MAALIADDAPRAPDLMERARRIMAKAPADRRWNVYVPQSKRYDNPLYADVQDNAAWDTVIPADIAPAAELVPAQNPDPVANAANAAAAAPANAVAPIDPVPAANIENAPQQGGKIRKNTFKKKTKYLPSKRKNTAKKNRR